MIKIFSPTDKVFTTNGDAVIKATRAVVTKTDNGDYFLYLECGLEYSQYIKANNIVVVDTPDGQQAFRFEANIESTGTRIKAKAWHVYYDAENYIIADSYVVNKNCNDALNHLNDATDNPSPFTVSSDVATISSFRCVRKSLTEAIDVVLSRWGGHLVRDNFDIKIKNIIGADNGVTIQYKKNLKDIAVTEDWTAVCTKVLPVGKDGYLLDELYLYSAVQYEIPYTKVVTFEQDNINEEDYNTEEEYKAALREDLIQKATAYLETAQYPAINYQVSANVEKITDVGDIVEVFDERLGLSLTAAVRSYEYDCILGKYENVEFGTQGASLSDLMSGISQEIQTAITENNENIIINLQAAVEVAEARIWQALGSSYVIYTGDSLTVVDRLPAESAVYCMRINEDGISFSNNGITGDYRKVWSIANEIDFSKIFSVRNLTADLVKGGIFSRGGNNDNLGTIKVYNASNELITELSSDGLIAYGNNGERLIINDTDGIKVVNRLDETIFYINGDTVENNKTKTGEINIADKFRLAPIVVYDEDDNIVNDGIGLLPLLFDEEG